MLLIDHGPVWHCLREWHIYGLALPKPAVELRCELGGALLVADAAARALLHVNASGALADGDIEVADEAGDAFYFGVGHYVDERM